MENSATTANPAAPTQPIQPAQPAPAASLFVAADSTTPPSAAEQEADAQALASALEQYIAQLDAGIVDLSQAMLDDEGLLFLDQLTTRSLASSVAVSPTAQTGLDAAIARSFEDLFQIGDLVQSSQLDSPAAGQDSLTQTIDQLDGTIQALRAEISAAESQLQLLTQRRDVAWNTYDALSNKAAELGMERSSANSEVRMGSLAIPPLEPLPGTGLIITAAIGGVLGLMLGIFIAFLAHYLGHAPFLRRKQAQAA